MDMNKFISGTRRRSLAVAIFFGVSAAASSANASQTENLYSNGEPVVDMEFFNAGEFSSEANFDKALLDAAKLGADYWRNILGLRLDTPWQIAFVTGRQPSIYGKTFSFDATQCTQNNLLAQMIQGNRILATYDLKTLANEDISADEVQSVLQENSPADDEAAVSYVTVGRYLGANRNGAVRGWHVDENTILPTNEQAADYVGALRLELARSLGAEVLLDTSKTPITFGENILDPNAWTLHLVDKNGNFATAGKQIITSEELSALLKNDSSLNAADFFVADDTIHFIGKNVSTVLDGAEFYGKSGLPINAWNGTDFDGVQTLIPGLMTALPYKNYSTFTELELAALQDIGYNINRKKFYGLSIYKSNGIFTNENNFSSSEPLAIGLHVFGTRNTVTQNGKISVTGNGAVGVRVDGMQNKIIIPSGTEISANGQRGKGVLISYGRDQNLNVDGKITATGDGGNAVEFNFGSNALGAGSEYRGSYLRYLRHVDTSGNLISAENLSLNMTNGFNYSANELVGALVNDFNLSGQLYGTGNAIYIGKNAFVKNINVNAGAQIFGDITSDWKNFTAEDGFLSSTPVQIQYNGQSYDATKYIPDLTTNLNFNTDLIYDGNINGANNIKMHVKAGTLHYGGTANVLNVEVLRGAQLFGGNFTLNDMTFSTANGLTDTTTGKFINHGTIGAGSPNTNLVINGDLISDGILQKISGGTAGSIIVNGNANINGSTVTTDSLLPNETATVLTANTITGNITNPVGFPVQVSGFLNATGAIVGNTLTVTTYESNNIGTLNGEEAKTFDAMSNMFENLAGDSQQNEMRDFFNLDPPDAKKSLHEIGSPDSARVMSVAQQNNAIDRMVGDRIGKIFAPEYFDVNIRPMNFADGDDDAPVVKAKVKVKRPENNFWLNYMKNWGRIRGGTDYHGSVIVAGYDRPFGKHVRAGIFATYGTIGYGAESSRATVYDTRIGLYAGYHNKASDVYFYVNGGQLRNSLHRGISSLDLSTNAKYKSHIVEIGGEYKYDLHYNDGKIWHVSPFINFQTSYLRQNGYQEHGAGVYNQHVESDSNVYFAAQAGIDLKRYYRRGMIGFRFGVKHGFTGADPDLKISYEGDGSNSYRLRNERDKTHFVFSLRGENEFARNWFIGGETEFQFGKHDHDVTASLMLRRIW